MAQLHTHSSVDDHQELSSHMTYMCYHEDRQVYILQATMNTGIIDYLVGVASHLDSISGALHGYIRSKCLGDGSHVGVFLPHGVFPSRTVSAQTRRLHSHCHLSQNESYGLMLPGNTETWVCVREEGKKEIHDRERETKGGRERTMFTYTVLFDFFLPPSKFGRRFFLSVHIELLHPTPVGPHLLPQWLPIYVYKKRETGHAHN